MFSFIQLVSDHIQVTPGLKVLKAAEYTDYLKTAELVAAAEKRAQAIAEKAQEAFEQECQKGYEVGLQMAREHMAEQMITTQTQVDDFLRRSEDTLAKLVLEGVKTILHQFDKTELTLSVISAALTQVRHQKNVVLHVHPSQIDTVKERIQDILSEFPEIGYVDVQADSRIKTAGCLLETETGIVDATLEGQLNSLKAGIIKGLKTEH